MPDIHQIELEIANLARPLNIPGYYFPTFRNFSDDSQPNIEIHGSTYHYVVAERGHVSKFLKTENLDELYYFAVRDLVFLKARDLVAKTRDPNIEFVKELHSKQLELMAIVNVPWAERLRLELVAK